MTAQLRPTTVGASHRLPPQPGEVIDRSSTLRFTWNGRPATAHRGDTIVSALAAAGERVSHHGYKMIGVGALVAGELLGEESGLLEPFRFSRYETGELHPTSHSPFPWS